MKKITFKKLVKETEKVNDQFPNQFDKRDRYMDLVEEVGELSQAMQIVGGRKFTNDPVKQKTIEDVSDAFSDVLYDLIMLSRDYDLDLEREYLAMLERLKKRLKKGEFETNE